MQVKSNTNSSSRCRTYVQDAFLSGRRKQTPGANKHLSGSAAALICFGPVFVGTALCGSAGFGDYLGQKVFDVHSGSDLGAERQIASLSTPFQPVKATTDTGSQYTDFSETPIELIMFIRNHIEAPFSASIANRLEYLLEASTKEGEDQSPLSSDSLRCFINFIQKETNLAEPGLVLSFSGNIRAEWRRSRKEHFAAEFLPNGQVRYVVFSYDKEHPSRVDRVTGLVSVGSLMKKVEPFRVLSWATC